MCLHVSGLRNILLPRNYCFWDIGLLFTVVENLVDNGFCAAIIRKVVQYDDFYLANGRFLEIPVL